MAAKVVLFSEICKKKTTAASKNIERPMSLLPQKLQTKCLKNRKWCPCCPYRKSLAVMTSLVRQSIINGICEHRHWLKRNDRVNKQIYGVAQFDTTL